MERIEGHKTRFKAFQRIFGLFRFFLADLGFSCLFWQWLAIFVASMGLFLAFYESIRQFQFICDPNRQALSVSMLETCVFLTATQGNYIYRQEGISLW